MDRILVLHYVHTLKHVILMWSILERESSSPGLCAKAWDLNCSWLWIPTSSTAGDSNRLHHHWKCACLTANMTSSNEVFIQPLCEKWKTFKYGGGIKVWVASILEIRSKRFICIVIKLELIFFFLIELINLSTIFALL